MPELERPAGESGATKTPSQRPPRQPAPVSLGMPPVPPSAARTSKLQRPPSPDAIRFPTPKMPQPSFNGGFVVARHDGPVPAATVSPFGAQPAMREPGFR
ncbi:hypothetical protein M407DRAFT_245510 [Tulasnella calospora MUT 4182]|uniref:Uncharacterized protein n=1 Tax=Tulasnella calospora MUT 4182 TaxID=1051891 RepID=A0A0C3Q9Q0_9AGAM|nr:hypothetical protein M407DRAFT_245510 [Tulasnella calospora MUT 4182]